MAHLDLLRPWARGGLGGFDTLRREMDELFDRFAVLPAASAAHGPFPAVNLYESQDGYVLTAELPGVAPEALEIALEGATLTLSGERKADVEEGASVHRRERPSGPFRRGFELPVPIDADKVEAVHRHGVLTLRLPKAPEHRPRQIRVQAG
jgi:HSP20 family protein